MNMYIDDYTQTSHTVLDSVTILIIKLQNRYYISEYDFTSQNA